MLIGVTLVFIAWFMARGASAWVGAIISEDVQAKPMAARPFASPLFAAASATKDGAPILKRNIFDSETGPLDGSSQELADSAQPVVTDPNAPPPQCGNGMTLVGALYQKQRPELSYAAVKNGGEAAKVLRIGERLGSDDIVDILPNAVYLGSGKVRRCQIQMFAVAGATTVATAPSVMPTAAPVGEAAPEGALSEQEISQGIKKISETEYHISPSLRGKILENYTSLTQGVRVSPRRSGGQNTGVRLFRMQSNSLLRTIGLDNGDELRTINGFNMADPKSALEAFTKLQSSDRLTLTLNRRGSPMTIDYKIQ